MARIVAIMGFRLMTAAATEAPTRSMATKRKRRPATVPTRPASTKYPRAFADTGPGPPVTATATQSVIMPTSTLIQNPVNDPLVRRP